MRALPSMMGEGGAPDVDVALTVREMVRMIRASHVSVDTLVEEPLDTPLGFGTGAGVIFGATGGVMEAAVRSAYYPVTARTRMPTSSLTCADSRAGRRPWPISTVPRCASPWRTGWATPPVCSTRFATAV